MQFLNADLEITSPKPLDAICAAFGAFGRRFFELHHGKQESGLFFASFEVHPQGVTCQEKIEAFCDAIEGFDDNTQQVWQTSQARIIDVGYQSDDLCKPFRDAFETKLLFRLAALDIRLAITIYPKTIATERTSR